jgi:hypothetical protein
MSETASRATQIYNCYKLTPSTARNTTLQIIHLENTYELRFSVNLSTNIKLSLGHEDVGTGEWKYSSKIFISALDSGLARSFRFIPGKTVSDTRCIGGWVGFGSGLDVTDKRRYLVPLPGR